MRKGNYLREPRAAGTFTCLNCARAFTGWRITAEYCTEKCRHEAWRKRRRAARQDASGSTKEAPREGTWR